MSRSLNLFHRLYNVLICLAPDASFPPNPQRSYLLWYPLLDTLKIIFCAGVIAVVLGLLLSGLLYFCHLRQAVKSYWLLNTSLNLIIATPYFLLVVFVINHFTKPYFNIHTGFSAGVFGLSLILTAVFARHCEQIFLQLPPELYWTAYTLGANYYQFMRFFVLPETRPALILKLNTLFVAALAYMSVLSFIGVQGLSYIAYTHGYNTGSLNFKTNGFYPDDLILMCIFIMFILAQIFYALSYRLAKYCDHH